MSSLPNTYPPFPAWPPSGIAWGESSNNSWVTPRRGYWQWRDRMPSRGTGLLSPQCPGRKARVFGETHPDHLGVGIGHAGDDTGVEGRELAVFSQRFVAWQFIGNHFRNYLRLVHQHRLAHDVANRKDVRHVGAHLDVDFDEAPSRGIADTV